MTVVLVGWKSYASKDDEQDGDGEGMVWMVYSVRIQMDKAKT
jgi:hypothetical protein